MKLKTYLEAIQATKEDKQKQLAPAHAEQSRAELSVKIAKLGIEIGDLEIEVTNAASAYPLDVDALSENLDQLAWAQRRLDQLQSIQKQLFPA